METDVKLEQAIEFVGKKGDNLKLEKIRIKPEMEGKTKVKVGKILHITLFAPVRVGSAVRKTRILENSTSAELIERGVVTTRKVQSISKNDEGEIVIETTTSFYKMTVI